MGEVHLEQDNVDWERWSEEQPPHQRSLAPGLLKEEKYTFQRKIQELVTWHKIPTELIINFEQMLLSYITVDNTR